MTSTEAELEPIELGVSLVLPGFEGPGLWQSRNRFDPAAIRLANRHYSRQSRGGRSVGGPGRQLTLVTPDERAVWITHYPEHALDGLDAFRCTLFRNEGAGLSSDLIRAAMRATEELWPSDHPRDGWITWIDSTAVRSSNPGYCYLMAGWWRDQTFVADRRRPHTIRLRCSAHSQRLER